MVVAMVTVITMAMVYVFVMVVLILCMERNGGNNVEGGGCG